MVRNSKSVANLPVNPLTCLLTEVSDLTRAGWKPNGARSPGQAKRHPGFSHSRVSAPCKGKSFNPLCCYSYLIADLAVLKCNIVCIFCSILAPCLKAFALSGRDSSNTRYPGCRFACPGLGAFGLSGRSRPNPKLEFIDFQYALCDGAGKWWSCDIVVYLCLWVMR